MEPRLQAAIDLMAGFGERTGLTSGGVPERYLWTDAFAVCNYLGLAEVTGDDRYARLALQLIEQVHHTLGRHRSDDPRTGWLSGLEGAAAEAKPTKGGLRIGKPLPERGPTDAGDPQLEWDRDGQYFHYLTKWMRALDQASRATSDPGFNGWARDLADTAFRAFTYGLDGGDRRMFWKMSIDLSRPLVPSMGQHDALDGYMTYLQLQSTASKTASVSAPDLADSIGSFDAMIDDDHLLTADPLGLGGLLLDAASGAQLMREGAPLAGSRIEILLDAAHAGLERYVRQDELRQPTRYRLAFRELGLAIGLHAVALTWPGIEALPERSPVRAHVEALERYAPLRSEIEDFWRDPAHRQTSTWQEHRNINDVMLATSLAPEGCVVLRPIS